MNATNQTDQTQNQVLEVLVDTPIRLDEYPQLRLIAWHIPHAQTVSAKDALSLYERNWRYVDQADLQPHEKALIDRLVLELGNGAFFG